MSRSCWRRAASARLSRRLSLPLREPVERGDGLLLARERGRVNDVDEFYGRALPVTPDELPEETWVRLGQVYGRHVLVLDETGAAIDIGHPAWHENDLVQEIARRPGGRAWFLVVDEALDQRVRDTTVAERGSRRRGRRAALSSTQASFRSRRRPTTVWCA